MQRDQEEHSELSKKAKKKFKNDKRMLFQHQKMCFFF